MLSYFTLFLMLLTLKSTHLYILCGSVSPINVSATDDQYVPLRVVADRKQRIVTLFASLIHRHPCPISPTYTSVIMSAGVKRNIAATATRADIKRVFRIVNIPNFFKFHSDVGADFSVVLY